MKAHSKELIVMDVTQFIEVMRLEKFLNETRRI